MDLPGTSSRDNSSHDPKSQRARTPTTHLQRLRIIIRYPTNLILITTSHPFTITLTLTRSTTTPTLSYINTRSLDLPVRLLPRILILLQLLRQQIPSRFLPLQTRSPPNHSLTTSVSIKDRCNILFNRIHFQSLNLQRPSLSQNNTSKLRTSRRIRRHPPLRLSDQELQRRIHSRQA